MNANLGSSYHLYLINYLLKAFHTSLYPYKCPNHPSKRGFLHHCARNEMRCNGLLPAHISGPPSPHTPARFGMRKKMAVASATSMLTEFSGVNNRGFWSDVSVLKGDLDHYQGAKRREGHQEVTVGVNVVWRPQIGVQTPEI